MSFAIPPLTDVTWAGDKGTNTVRHQVQLGSVYSMFYAFVFTPVSGDGILTIAVHGCRQTASAAKAAEWRETWSGCDSGVHVVRRMEH